MKFFSWDKVQATHKIALFSLGALLVSYLLYDFVLSPQWAQIDDLKGKLVSEQQQVKVIENFVLAHPNPEQHLIELDTKLAQINNKFPDSPDISSFLLQIEQLSRECGVQLSYLRPTKINAKEGFREFEVEFLINGTFVQNMNFLTKTENGLRFISLTNIAMKLDKKNLESKVTAKVYSYGVSPASSIPITVNTDTPNIKK